MHSDKNRAGAAEPRPITVDTSKAAQESLALDRLIHERVRLGILSATDGNLSVHARRLEEAEYIQCTKSFEGRLPRTEYKLTPAGRKALERYLDHMESLIRATREK
jgi:DNA-binding HxlR family transcriptional regulator